MNKSKLGLAADASHVKRWAGHSLVGHRSSIAEHSFEVAYYTDLLVKFICFGTDLVPANTKIRVNKLKGDILTYALHHDLGEITTGDIPYIAKRDFPDLKKAADEAEAQSLVKLGIELTTDPMIKFIVKVADMLAVSREIQTEVTLGNIYIDKYANVVQEIWHATEKKFDKLRVDPNIIRAGGKFYRLVNPLLAGD